MSIWAAAKRSYARKYGLTASEVEECWPNALDRMTHALEDWREAHGLPAHDSPLVRDKLLELARSGRFKLRKP